MVVEQQVDGEDLDDVFHALADPTRRDIVCRAADGDWSVSKLARRYPMSFAAVQKHVAVLERAGLVCKEARGRERIVRANPAAIDAARAALDQLAAQWRGRAERMADLLAQPTEPNAPAKEPGQ